MSLAWHVAVKVVFALQVTNFPFIKFSSTHKVLTSLTPSQISEAKAVTSRNFPSLPHSSATRCRVGWSDSVPVAFAHVLEYCRHFVILFCSPCAGKFEKHARKVSHVYLICSKLGCLYERKRFTSIVRKAGEGTGSYHLHCTGFHQLPYTLPAASTTLVWGKLKFNTFSCTGLARTHRFDEFYTILFEVVCLDRLRWKYFYTKSC